MNWGGAGSIADNSLIPRNGDHSLDGPRATLEDLFINLGRVTAFEKKRV